MEPIFGVAKDPSVVFCVDASKRQKEIKRVIFQHIIEHLNQMRNNFIDCKFNVILFGSHVINFANHMQTVTTRTTAALQKWFRGVKFSPTSYALPGLLSAVNNDNSHSIYFITDGLSHDDEHLLQDEIKNISTHHVLSIFLITEQLPPDEKSLRMFCELAADNPDAWGSITLITSKRQAEVLRLTTSSLNSTESSSLGETDNCGKTLDDMQKWLDEQATLVTGARVQPACPPPRSIPKSQPRSRDTSRNRSLPSTKSRSSSKDGSIDGSVSRGPKLAKSSSSEEDANGKRNIPYSRHSRSSSREELGYHGGVPQVMRRPSVRSASSSVDSAGSILIGRHVLVPRRDHGNRLYLGVIKSQKKDKRFGVVFCIPYGGNGDEEGLEYCMQEVDIDEILSYVDLYRHAICEKDDVLVPAVLLQSRDTDESPNLQTDPPFAGHPYVLAVANTVSFCAGITDSPGRKTSTLVVKVAGSRRPRLCDIPTGCALWIPEKQARQLYSQGCHFFEPKNPDNRDSSPGREERESLCMHGAPCSPSRFNDYGDAESHRSGKDSDIYRRGYSVSPTHRRENSDVSSVLEKRSESSSRRSGASSFKPKRPMWQYWGKGGIPDLLDPPSHEPYVPMRVFGPAALASSHPGNEWPASQFTIVNHSLDNITAQNDSTRVYEAMRQVDPPPALSQSVDLCTAQIPPKENEEGDVEDLLFRSCEGDENGLAGLSLRELYRKRLRNNIKKSKTSSACDPFNRHRSVAKSVKSQ
ncbi:hypothetical protein Aperf_G00000080711 [Anoplocephala perfoliata]